MATAAPSPFRTPELRALVADMVRDDRENGVFRVNRKAFIDQTIFELEREAIFNHSWLYLGHVSGGVRSPARIMAGCMTIRDRSSRFRAANAIRPPS